MIYYDIGTVLLISLSGNCTPNARVKGHLEPTHLKSSPLFTFSTKSLGQDSPSIHLFSKKYWVKIHHRENKVG